MKLATLSLSGVVALLNVVSCSLDTRQLQYSSASAGDTSGAGRAGGGSAPDGQGGAGSEAGESSSEAGEPSGGSSAGTTGAAGSTNTPLIDGCTDLDGDHVDDCSETLLENASFRSDVKGWAPEKGAALAWDAANASSDSGSGSALLSANSAASPNAQGAVLLAASQCISVAGEKLVIAYANAQVAADQDTTGFAEVELYFFDEPGCGGAFTTNFWTPQPLDAAPGAWLDLNAGSVTRASTKSALVKLTISRPLKSPFAARFDNVLVKAKSL